MSKNRNRDAKMKDRINRLFRTFCFVLWCFVLGLAMDIIIMLPVFLAVGVALLHYGILASGYALLVASLVVAFFCKELVWWRFTKLGSYRNSLRTKILDSLDPSE